MTTARRWHIGAAAAAVVLALPVAVPQVLAFPYHARSHGNEVWSETPLPQAQLDSVIARSAGLVAASPLADPAGEPRHIFLTNGGWRWTWLALQNRGTFALTRAANEAVIINRSNLAADRMANGRPGADRRTLSGIIAHETCHGMERRALGIVASDIRAPQWLREGYCDHVARESTLTPADVVRLQAEGRTPPALVYYQGRQRIEAELARNGGDVHALFARY